ncbi:MAG: hypothetical protein MN733_33750 [Nitrososphaera sp.]|nr:hypothetical protein [Nitrososphaera sp.]
MALAHNPKLAITNDPDWPIPTTPLPTTPRSGVLSGQTIRKLGIVSPFCERTKFEGMTYGLSAAGYDIRLGHDAFIFPDGLTLVASMESFKMPNNVLGVVHDKSSWARQGLLIQNTVIECGWHGYLTLEITLHKLSNQPLKTRKLLQGTPIAQIIFHWLDEPAEQPYNGKYQNQPNVPVAAILEP